MHAISPWHSDASLGEKACLWAWLLQELVGFAHCSEALVNVSWGQRATSYNWSLRSLSSLGFDLVQRNIRAVHLHPPCVTVSERWGRAGTSKSRSSSQWHWQRAPQSTRTQREGALLTAELGLDIFGFGFVFRVFFPHVLTLQPGFALRGFVFP